MSNTTGDSLGSTLGEKVKGAWNVIEGAGDSLRGSIMDFVDSATGSDGHHAETDIGKQKMQEGLAELRGDPKAVPATGTQATDTKTTPLPPPARSTDATDTGATGTTATTGHDTTSAIRSTGKGIAP
ncbi:uncharacterized protein LAESUDRAFT_811930 [Laetiporus sulphureus 93-53]|uniref:CsbD-like domain-containing protein n=1 Tax=Laetiporus sulphureus 93-53 TaxID=1314785 RepID=A0A165ESM1_9APHY|nr:uncharacterized protein LAESUDRAFT_811930 [Laetiporus sulphureus 93-53]KZT07674.1 hypothetical protein LAESUDRAFT_811930 [Laetiporus sulphureus 93-53]